MSNDMSTLIMSIIMAGTIVGLIVYVILVASLWKIFTKRGEKGFKAIIPIYNIYILMKIVNMPGWMIVLYFIPVVNLFALAFLSVRIASTFGKGAGFAIGLLFFPFLFYPILAFSKGEKEDPVEEIVVREETDEGDLICSTCGTTLPKDATVCFICNEPVENKVMSSEEQIDLESPEIRNSDNEMPIEIEKQEIEEESPFSDLKEQETPFQMPEEFSFPKEEIFEIPKQSEETLFSLDDHEEKDSLDPLQIAKEYNDFEQEDHIMPSHYTDKKEDLFETHDSYHEGDMGKQKYKSSTKTLDEVLRINSDLYAAQEESRKARIEKQEEPLTPSKIEKINEEANRILKMIEENERAKRKLQEEKEAEEFKILKENRLKQIQKNKPKETEQIVHIPLISEMETGIKEEEKYESSLDEKQEKKEQSVGRLRTCPSCGSTIPRYSHRCLLCGTQIS